MISPPVATAILVSFLVIFGVLVPVLNIKFSQYVSFRWICVVVVLALLIGVCIDFEGLDTQSRHIIMIGALALSGAYVLLRTIEKFLFNGWIGRGEIRLHAKKGDAEGDVVIKPPDDPAK